MGHIMWLRTGCLEGRAEQAERPARGPASYRRGAGVRALIVALKPGNAGGAKGCRKVEMDQAERRKRMTGVSALVATRLRRGRGSREELRRTVVQGETDADGLHHG